MQFPVVVSPNHVSRLPIRRLIPPVNSKSEIEGVRVCREATRLKSARSRLPGLRLPIGTKAKLGGSISLTGRFRHAHAPSFSIPPLDPADEFEVTAPVHEAANPRMGRFLKLVSS